MFFIHCCALVWAVLTDKQTTKHQASALFFRALENKFGSYETLSYICRINNCNTKKKRYENY